MKCKHTEKNILLAQSGELGSIGRWRLVRHLSRCPKCNAYQKDLQALTHVVRNSPFDAEIRDPVIEQILNVAKKESSRSYEIRFRPSHESPLRQWRYAIIYSALSVLLLTGLVLITLPDREAPVQTAATAPAHTATPIAWEDDFDEEISDLGSDLQLATSDDWLGSSSSDENSGEDIDSIARELLSMEGQQI